MAGKGNKMQLIIGIMIGFLFGSLFGVLTAALVIAAGGENDGEA